MASEGGKVLAVMFAMTLVRANAGVRGGVNHVERPAGWLLVAIFRASRCRQYALKFEQSPGVEICSVRCPDETFICAGPRQHSSRSM